MQGIRNGKERMVFVKSSQVTAGEPVSPPFRLPVGICLLQIVCALFCFFIPDFRYFTYSLFPAEIVGLGKTSSGEAVGG